MRLTTIDRDHRRIDRRIRAAGRCGKELCRLLPDAAVWAILELAGALNTENSMAIDLTETLQRLREQLAHVTQAIAALEGMSTASTPGPPGRRGRKSMDEGERKAVSARMKKYWAQRRERGAAAGQG